MRTKVYQVSWRMEARNLRSTKKIVVSPPFSLHLLGDQSYDYEDPGHIYRIVLYPASCDGGKGTQNFVAACGDSRIYLKRDLNSI